MIDNNFFSLAASIRDTEKEIWDLRLIPHSTQPTRLLNKKVKLLQLLINNTNLKSQKMTDRKVQAIFHEIYKIDKFINYAKNFYLTPYDINQKTSIFQQQFMSNNSTLHRNIINAYQAIIPLSPPIKLARKKTIGQPVSLLKISGELYVITSVIIAPPTGRSIVKIIVPLIEIGSGLLLQFSKPKLLKIIYDLNIPIDNLEAIRLLYGYGVHVFSRAGETQKQNLKPYFEKKYIVMPILPGTLLTYFCYTLISNYYFDTAITSTGLCLLTIVDILLAMAIELNRLHKSGWVHNDIKPENMQISKGPCQGSDFKITIFDADDMIAINSSQYINTNHGTPTYMAPELREANFTNRFTNDIYSLGISFIEIILCDKHHVTLAKIRKAENAEAHKNVIIQLLLAWETRVFAISAQPLSPSILSQITAMILKMLELDPDLRSNPTSLITELYAIKVQLQHQQINMNQIISILEEKNKAYRKPDVLIPFPINNTASTNLSSDSDDSETENLIDEFDIEPLSITKKGPCCNIQ